jgi:hypothetical protein
LIYSIDEAPDLEIQVPAFVRGQADLLHASPAAVVPEHPPILIEKR